MAAAASKTARLCMAILNMRLPFFASDVTNPKPFR